MTNFAPACFFPACLVPECDAQADWPLPLLVLTPELAILCDGVEIQRDVALTLVAVAVAVSEEGRALLDRFEAALEGQSIAGLRAEGPGGIAAVLAGALARAQERVARQVREIGQMRQAAERSLQSFERLEAFVWASAKAERQSVLHLAPLGALAAVSVEQRLPTDSSGLCDVALHVTTAGRGRLCVTLGLMESAETCATWTIADPQPGWLRLALPRALGPDAQTPVLRVDWQGEGLELGLSLPHPDARFQAAEGAVLALRLWKFIPGTMAPLSPEALAPDGMRSGGRWLIGLAAMSEAARLAADPRIELTDALVMRPGAGETMALCLPGLGRPGLARLQGHVALEGAGVMAELAYALAPPGSPPEAIDWQIFGSDEPGQIHHLPHPSAEVRDLWLLARMPEDVEGAVIFERIEGFADANGRDV